MMNKKDRELVPSLLVAYGGDKKKVAEHLGRDCRFVTRWAARAEAGQGFGNAPGAGRKRLLDGAATSVAKRLASATTKHTSKEIANKLEATGVTPTKVSASTVRRAVSLRGRIPLKYMGLARRQHLTDKHKEKRELWAAENLDTDWENVMVTDSHKCIQGKATHRRRWQNPQRPKTVDVQLHGMQAHIYAGATAHGVTRLHFVTGTTGLHSHTKGVDATEYCQVIDHTLVPEGNRLFNGRPFTVYQDGAGPHTANKTKQKWAEYEHVQLLQSPPLSPDLNWIENLWDTLEDKLMGKTYRTSRTFKAAIERAWAEITQEQCKKHVESMPGRLAKCIQQRGGHIERNIYS